jgi:2-polyprenyl-6-methoxyphenol hydroxylase-like FAD-dependent oxidoreductase
VRIDGGSLDHDNIYLWWGRGGTVALFPFERETWRIFAMRTGDADGDMALTLAELQDHADRHGPPGLRLRDPSWLSAFRINERVVARYRMGRCFLAGDAAHIHSPAGGQGMNTGIQDAISLAGVLADVVTGAADVTKLDSWAAARHHVAAEVVAFTDRMTRMATLGSPAARSLRNAAIGAAGHLPFLTHALARKLSELESQAVTGDHAGR